MVKLREAPDTTWDFWSPPGAGKVIRKKCKIAAVFDRNNNDVCASTPRKGIQETLYPDAPGMSFQDKVMELIPTSTTFSSFTLGTGPESETAAGI